MMGKTSLIRPAWRPAGAHASRHAPWTSHVHGVRFESLSAPETHGKQGITLQGNTLVWCKAQLNGPVAGLDQRVHRPKVPTATPDMGLWFNPLAGDSEPNVDLQCRWALADRSTVMASDDQGRKQGLLRQCGSSTDDNISMRILRCGTAGTSLTGSYGSGSATPMRWIWNTPLLLK